MPKGELPVITSLIEGLLTSPSADLEGVTILHEDALIIRATIANYGVARVFVDSRSLVNILFKEAFDKCR